MQVRVLTWNIHKCIGGIDRRYDLDRVAQVLAAAEADLCMLQEVAEDGTRYRGDCQFDELCERLDYSHHTYFVNVRLGPRRGAYGNAILSRWPILGAENIDLTQPRKRARSVLHAQLRLSLPDQSTRTLHAFNLHLGLSERERRRQLTQFLAGQPFARLHLDTPIVVAGDFNDVWGTLGPRFDDFRIGTEDFTSCYGFTTLVAGEHLGEIGSCGDGYQFRFFGRVVNIQIFDI